MVPIEKDGEKKLNENININILENQKEKRNTEYTVNLYWQLRLWATRFLFEPLHTYTLADGTEIQLNENKIQMNHSRMFSGSSLPRYRVKKSRFHMQFILLHVEFPLVPISSAWNTGQRRANNVLTLAASTLVALCVRICQ